MAGVSGCQLTGYLEAEFVSKSFVFQGCGEIGHAERILQGTLHFGPVIGRLAIDA